MICKMELISHAELTAEQRTYELFLKNRKRCVFINRGLDLVYQPLPTLQITMYNFHVLFFYFRTRRYWLY